MTLIVLRNIELKGSRLQRCIVNDGRSNVIDSISWSNSMKHLYDYVGENTTLSYGMLRQVDYNDNSSHVYRIKNCTSFAISFNGVSPNKFYQELINLCFNAHLKIQLNIKLSDNVTLNIVQDYTEPYDD